MFIKYDYIHIYTIYIYIYICNIYIYIHIQYIYIYIYINILNRYSHVYIVDFMRIKSHIYIYTRYNGNIFAGLKFKD